MKTTTTLTYPCTLEQNTDNFTRVSSGQHCSQCDKVVTDFTSFSDQELLLFLQANVGKGCGIFRPEQVNQQRSWWFGVKNEFKAAAVFVMAILATRTVSAGDGKTIVAANPAVTDNDQVRMLSTDSVIFHARGQVLSKKGKPLQFTRVRAYRQGTNEEIAVAYTDSAGNFEIMIPAAADGETFDLKFSRYRYHEKTIRNYTPGMELLEIHLKYKSRKKHGIFGRRRHYTMGKY